MAKSINRLEAKLKAAIKGSPMSRYAISKASGVSQPTLSRFMAGERGLSVDAADKLLTLFKLEIRPARPGQRKGK